MSPPCHWRPVARQHVAAQEHTAERSAACSQHELVQVQHPCPAVPAVWDAGHQDGMQRKQAMTGIRGPRCLPPRVLNSPCERCVVGQPGQQLERGVGHHRRLQDVVCAARLVGRRLAGRCALGAAMGYCRPLPLLHCCTACTSHSTQHFVPDVGAIICTHTRDEGSSSADP